jgi:hypothetical protein
MSLRSKIIDLIQEHQEPSFAAWEILDMLDDQGLSLYGNGWLELDETYVKNKSYFGLTEIVQGHNDPNQAALHILLRLEEIGLSLSGNGWLDDDKEALEFVCRTPDPDDDDWD